MSRIQIAADIDAASGDTAKRCYRRPPRTASVAVAPESRVAPTTSGAEVKAEFRRTGKSISGWARAHGYSAPLVFEVLRGRLKGKRGKAHEVAVLLGLKDGVIEREGGR